MKANPINLAGLLSQTKAAASQTAPDLEAARKIESELAAKHALHLKAEGLASALASAEEDYNNFERRLDELFSEENRNKDLSDLIRCIGGASSKTWEMVSALAAYEQMQKFKPMILKKYREETVGPAEESIREFAKKNGLNL